MRACHAADRTGHMILQTLYQQCIKNKVNFFDEFHVVDLIRVGNTVRGVVAVEIAPANFTCSTAKRCMFATGGWGRCWEVTSNAHSLTGDGAAICLRNGIPWKIWSFSSSTPRAFSGWALITEGVRGEGGACCINGKGERFMEKYAPTLKIWPAAMWSAGPFTWKFRRDGASTAKITSSGHSPGNGEPLFCRGRRNAAH
jgi:succinate dehydrogenase / fumarate reductase flavoprotein subunit